MLIHKKEGAVWLRLEISSPPIYRKILIQEKEGASLSGHWGLQRLQLPELEPIEVVGAIFDVIFVALVLEEKLFVTPKRCCDLRAGHDPAN